MSKDGLASQHDAALDGLRGIAIALVLVTHTFDFEAVRPQWVWVNAIADAGWIGVDLFFVLSGFLITRILIELRDAPKRLRLFYGRRALRILPAYFFYLLLAVPLLLLFAAPPYPQLTRESLPWLLVFLQNFHQAWSDSSQNLGPLSHLWSLAVEEQFYLFWPFVVWRFSTAKLGHIALGFMLLAVACKLALALMDAPPQVPYLLTLTRMDGFAAGAWLAVWLASGKPALTRWVRLLPWFAAATLLLTIFAHGSAVSNNIWTMTLWLSLTPLVFAGLLYAVLLSPPLGLLRELLGHRVLVFLGRHSYALYLVHAGIAVLMQLLLMPHLKLLLPGNAGRVLLIVLIWLASISMALLIDRLIDAPARKLKQRLYSSTEAKPAHTHPAYG